METIDEVIATKKALCEEACYPLNMGIVLLDNPDLLPHLKRLVDLCRRQREGGT